MKNRVLRALALSLAMLLACAIALADVRTTASVNLRSGPGKNYEIVTSFSSGKTLTYLGETSTDERGIDWYKVSSGNFTGWVSSMYSELEGEAAKPAATEAPAEAPAEEPEPTQAPAEGAAGLPALNAGGLFAGALGQDAGTEPAGESEPVEEPVEESEPADEPEPTVVPFIDLSADAAAGPVELSNYYRADLVTAANEIGLISYRQVESEAPYQYYNDALILAGNQNVENIVIHGEGYEVYGVRVGMDANTAMAWLNAAGLDYMDSANGLTYEHKAAADAPFADANGHDSCINLWLDDDNIVTEIDWSTYTG